MYGETTTLYDIPLNHLDYKYITECDKLKELEKILKVLRSGKEGRYPDLESHCEAKIRLIDVDNRLLRKAQNLLNLKDLPLDERENVLEDLKEWVEETKHNETVSKFNLPIVNDSGGEPKVRNWGLINPETGAGTRVKPAKHSTSKPRTYEEWSKLEKELEKEMVEDEMKTEQGSEVSKNSICGHSTAEKPSCVGLKQKADSLSMAVRSIHALREKEKGNEALISGDYHEALGYYDRSLIFEPTLAVYNNRALLYLKQKKWKSAVDDCDRVIKAEPSNVKALFRRSRANYELHCLEKSEQDLKTILLIEPESTKAKSLLQKVKEEHAKRQPSHLEGGRRMVIDEVESEEDEDEGDESETETESEEEEEEEEDNNKYIAPKAPERRVIRDSSPINRGVVIEEYTEEENEEKPKKKQRNKRLFRSNKIDNNLLASESVRKNDSISRNNDSTEIAVTEFEEKYENKTLNECESTETPKTCNPDYSERMLKKRNQLIKQLEIIGPKKLKTVLGLKLDAQLLEEYIFGLHTFSQSKKSYEFIYLVLEELSKSPRFDVASMLLDEDAKKTLLAIFDELRTSPLSGSYNIAALQSIYEV